MSGLEVIAYNKSTPKDILKVLSKDKEWDVRKSVAENPNYKENK